MALTLLQIVNAAQAEIGLPVSSSVIGNTDQITGQMLALLTRVGDQVRARAWWTKLQSVWVIETTPPVYLLGNVLQGSAGIGGITLNTAAAPAQAGLTTIQAGWALQGEGIDYAAQVASVAVTDPNNSVDIVMTEPAAATAEGVAIIAVQTSYPLPSDWERAIPDTGWDRGERWRMGGPLSPAEDEFFKSGLIQSAPWRKFRFVGGGMVFSPPVSGTAFGSVAIEYMSNAWIVSGGARATAFATDADTCIFRDDVMVMGLKAAFKQAKGLDYAAEAGDWQRQLQLAVAADNPQRTLSLARGRRGMPGGAQIQDGNFPGPAAA